MTRILVKDRLLSESFETILIYLLKNHNCRIIETLLELNKSSCTIKQNRNYTIRTLNKISFTPKGKKTIMISSNKWERKNRQTSKIGKIVKQLNLKSLIENLTEKETNDFVSLINSQLNKGTFKIVKGQDIIKWYNEDCYEPKSGTLNNSCMRYDNCDEYLEIYAKNPDKCSLLIYVSEINKLLGRSLLWKSDKDVKIMDRIYSNEPIKMLFQNWATENNFISKHKIPYPTKISINTDFSSYPYLDTFDHIHEGFISNSSEYGVYLGIADQTNGELSDNGTTYCDITERSYPEEDVYYINSADIYAHYSLCVEDELYNNEYILSSDSIKVLVEPDIYANTYKEVENDKLVFCKEIDTYAAKKLAFYCNHSHQYYLSHRNQSIDIDNIGIIHKQFSNEYYSNLNNAS